MRKEEWEKKTIKNLPNLKKLERNDSTKKKKTKNLEGLHEQRRVDKSTLMERDSEGGKMGMTLCFCGDKPNRNEHKSSIFQTINFEKWDDLERRKIK